jgi:hypothetical protein
MKRNIRQYRDVWLASHPGRSLQWLNSMFKQGFEIHHVDGNYNNNHPDNLVLIEAADHQRLHGMFGLRNGAFKDRLSERGKKAAAARWAKISKNERSEIMRTLVQRRWR